MSSAGSHLSASDGRSWSLIGDIVTLGRDPTCDIGLVEDAKVSRTHAELRLETGQWLIVDTDSRNGTFVNGRSTTHHPLRDGDKIRVGQSELIYHRHADPNATELEVARDALPRLSPRERQILSAVAQGLTDQEIATSLHIGISTVRSHLERIRTKTGLRRRSELTRLAIDLEAE